MTRKERDDIVDLLVDFAKVYKKAAIIGNAYHNTDFDVYERFKLKGISVGLDMAAKVLMQKDVTEEKNEN